MKVIKVPFSEDLYFPEVTKKTQIALHHTVSDPFSHIGDKATWEQDKSRIATSNILTYNGDIFNLFSTRHWAHHLGVKIGDLKKLGFKDFAIRNQMLNKSSIAIEIDSWGGLVKGNGKRIQFGKKANGTPNIVLTSEGVFYNVYGRPIDKRLEVIEISWRGFHYFQKYSDEQLATLEELLPLQMKANGIPNHGLKNGDFGVSMDALSGVPGIWSHSNYRADKSDLYPDERLVKLLNRI